MKLIIIAPSGGGKGSLADLIVKDYGIPNISTGDIFREHIKKGTPLGKQAKGYIDKGEWVPDEVTINMLLERIKQSDCTNGFILDGFPRTLNQAKELAKHVTVDAVVELDITDKLVMERLAGRWMCGKCNKIHNSRYNDISKGCIECGSALHQREDDKEEFIARRLQQYREQFKSILDFYKKAGKFLSVPIKPEYFPPDTYKIVKKYFDERGFKKVKKG